MIPSQSQSDREAAIREDVATASRDRLVGSVLAALIVGVTLLGLLGGLGLIAWLAWEVLR